MSRKIQFAFLFLLLGLFSIAAQSAFAQQPLTFGNNYFVTGDYVVAGAYGLNTNYAHDGTTTGIITIPDVNPGITGTKFVPAGAQVVKALLYWQTVEKAGVMPGQPGSGQNGFFRPLFKGGPQTGYAMTGTSATGNNSVPWSSGCTGPSPGKIVRTYRADVTDFLPQDANGNVVVDGIVNGTLYGIYEVRLPSVGSSAPLTLGATLVVIYRVLSPDFPLNSIVIYDGAFAQNNSSLIMTQTVQGFDDAAHKPVSRLTHIVGGGKYYKYETAYLNNVPLPPLYFTGQPFPGFYGTWDNTTWTFGAPDDDPLENFPNPVHEDNSSATTQVIPAAHNPGCVSWGAVIVSTTVKNSDHDGLLDVWKVPTAPNNPLRPGYCDASVNEGVCNQGDANWVDLPGAVLGEKDVFLQLDYMCSSVTGADSCDTSGNNYSFDPRLTKDPNTGKSAVDKVIDAYLAKGIHLHVNPITPNLVQPAHAIPEPTCTDAPNSLCIFPGQPGVVAWKGDVLFFKNQLIDPDEPTKLVDCTGASPEGSCVPRFQPAQKDSYHYALWAHTLGLPNWTLLGGSLASAVQSGHTVTFTTSTAHGLIVDPNLGNGRVTVAFAITNPSLNGTYLVQSVPNSTTFTIQTPNSANAVYTASTDPNFGVVSGNALESGTISGFSDIGGSDSLITLGSWGANGQTWQIKASTFMHELGHSNGLTHGGFYFDKLANDRDNYTPTVEGNCKSNFQSVMSYEFQLALIDTGTVDGSGNPIVTVDYSGQGLNQGLQTINEGSTTGAGTFSNLFYPITSWYIPWTGVGTPATQHCDGTSLLNTDPKMSQFNGSKSSLSWSGNQDINFDGAIETSLRPHNDWADTVINGVTIAPGINLQQISAAASMSSSGSHGFGGGSGSHGFGGGSGSHGFGGGSGASELNVETANAVTFPPRNLVASEGASPRLITLNWAAPAFGQIVKYKIYRSENGGAFTVIATLTGNPPVTTYTDTVTCDPGGYRYFVTAVISAGNPPQDQESVPSNTVPTAGQGLLTGCYTNVLPSTNTPPSPVALTDLSAPTNAPFIQGVAPFPTITWSLQDDWSGPLLQNNVYKVGGYVNRTQANTLVAIGPIPNDGACSTLAKPPTHLNFPGPGPYPYTVTTLSASGSGLSFGANQFSFNWDTTNFNAGCYFFELDLDSGQSETTASALTLDIFVSDSGPHVITASLPDATVGVPYANTVFESGGTNDGAHAFSWTIVPNSVMNDGSPVAGIPGISFQPNGIGVTNGTLSGTATTAGTYTFTAQATDSVGNVGLRMLTLRVLIYVSDSPPFTTTTSLPDGVVGIPYSNTVYESGGTANNTTAFSWTIISGALPSGVSFQPNAVGITNGTLSGTPTTAGDYTFTAQVTDSAGNFGTQTFMLHVAAAPAGLVYVANCTGTCTGVDTGSVSAYIIEANTGALAPVSGSPFAAGVSPYWVTDPAGRFAYVANLGGNVSAYSIDATTGGLTPVSGSPFSSGGIPSSVTVDPSGRFAYVATRNGFVSEYTIDAVSGALTAVGSPVATGSSDFTVTVDPSGRFAYVANQGDNTISAYSIDQTTGALTVVSGSPFLAGTAPFVIAVDPAAPFAYVANDGDSTISAYSIDSTTGALSSIGSPITTGALTNPRSLTVDPLGQFVYTANHNGSVSAFSINVTTGALSAVGLPLAAGSQPDSVAVDATSKFAYVANAGSNNVSAYTINGTTGALTAVSGAPFNAGAFPASVVATTYACAAFPAGPAPFATIYSIARDTAGDAFVVGTLTGGTLPVLPIPSVSNERFCNPVTLETNYTVPAYVPTAAERTGDFSAYSGLTLLDQTGNPYPGNSLPAGVFAWRIAPHSPNLTRLSCSLEPTLHSIEGHTVPTSTATSIQFANDTAGDVNVYWLNYQGQRVFYRGGPYSVLAAGTSYTQGTFITHPWVITDVANNRCLGIWLPTESLGTAVITGSAPLPLPPQPPANLNAAVQPSGPITAASVVLTWNASNGAAGYNVYRSIAPQGPFTKLTTSGPTANLTFTDTSVVSGTTYYYLTTAVDVSGNESAYSNQTLAMILTPPLPPTGLSATATTTPSVVLTWTASLSNNVAGYNVYQATSPVGPFAKLTSVPTTNLTFTDTTVLSGSGTTYYYMTTAVDGSGNESVYSNPASALIP